MQEIDLRSKKLHLAPFCTLLFLFVFRFIPCLNKIFAFYLTISGAILFIWFVFTIISTTITNIHTAYLFGVITRWTMTLNRFNPICIFYSTTHRCSRINTCHGFSPFVIFLFYFSKEARNKPMQIQYPQCIIKIVFGNQRI